MHIFHTCRAGWNFKKLKNTIKDATAIWSPTGKHDADTSHFPVVAVASCRLMLPLPAIRVQFIISWTHTKLLLYNISRISKSIRISLTFYQTNHTSQLSNFVSQMKSDVTELCILRKLWPFVLKISQVENEEGKKVPFWIHYVNQIIIWISRSFVHAKG